MCGVPLRDSRLCVSVVSFYGLLCPRPWRVEVGSAFSELVCESSSLCLPVIRVSFRFVLSPAVTRCTTS